MGKKNGKSGKSASHNERVLHPEIIGTRTPLVDERGAPLEVGKTYYVSRDVERRDPQAGVAPVTFTSPGSPMITEWDGDSAYRWGYIANTYVFRCVDQIATAIAACPFRAGTDPSKESDWNDKAMLAQLLGPPPGSPNPDLSPRRLWKWTVAQRLITGRWYWEIERSSPTATKGTVLGLWPLPSSLIDPIPSSKGRQYFDGFVFGKNLGDKKRQFVREQLCYDWNPAQGNDIRQPESVLQAARLDISVAVMQDRYDVAFLKNDARPAAVIVHEEFAEKAEREAFRQQFLAEYRGVDNAGKPIFVEATPGEEELNQTFHIERLGLSQKDAEFIARYESKIRAICIAFGTPLSILGDSSARTFDNAGQEYRNWWEGTLIPLQEELEDAVNMRLAPAVGTEIGWWDRSDVAALKSQSKIVSLGAGVTGMIDTVFTVDEVRNEYGLPPLEDVMTPEEKAMREAKQQASLAGMAALAGVAPQEGKQDLDKLEADEGKNTKGRDEPRPLRAAASATPELALAEGYEIRRVNIEERDGQWVLADA